VGCIKVGIAWHELLDIGQERPLTVFHVGDSKGGPSSGPTAGYVGLSDEVMSSLVAKLTSLVVFSLEPAIGDKITDVVTQTFAEVLTRFWPKPPIPLNSANLRQISDIVVHPSRRRDLCAFFKDPQAEFSCPEQAVLLEHMVEGRENIFGITGTGSGKTTLIMLLAKMYGNGLTTLVVLPLSALHGDFERRSHKHGLIVSKWHPNPDEFNPNADIVTCAVEYLEFLGFHECVDPMYIKKIL
jgi:hypothetical protein